MRKLAQQAERKGLLSAMIAIALCFSAMLGILVSSSSDRTDTAAREGPNGDDMTYARTLAFAVHDPISIDGNVGFAGPNTSTGVTTGSGTEYDPYIIEGWETKSVSIANANAHFVIRNCYVHPGEGAFTTDIRINSCENGTVRDCICTDSTWAGISIDYSNNNSFFDNDCTGKGYGVWLTSSGNITLTDNNCSSNSWSGISGTASNSNIINNTCSFNDGYGISLGFSYNNSLIDNNCSSNGEDGMSVYRSSICTLTNNTCSMNVWNGINLYLSNNNILSNNNCSSNNNHGIVLNYSNNNILIGSNCSSNNWSGINLMSSCSNNLTGNNCSSNDASGIGLTSFKMTMPPDPSGDNRLVNNTCSSNGYDGIVVSFSDRNDLINNTCSSNNENGIFVIMASNIGLRNNICSNNGCGLYFGSGFNHVVQSNWFVNNTGWGIYMIATPGTVTMIWNNTFIGNNGAGETRDPGHVQAFAQGDASWNSTDGYGNYWSDWTGPDSDRDGIVDAPYVLDGGAVDNYPRTTTPSEPIPEFGMMPFVVIALLVTSVLIIGARRRKAL